MLDRYVLALKREFILSDLMRDFIDNTKSFLAIAEQYYFDNQLNNFLKTYSQRYGITMTFEEIEPILTQLSNVPPECDTLTKIAAIKIRIQAGISMDPLLATLNESSNHVLGDFTKKYNELSDKEKEQITKTIIDSTLTFDSRYLLGILTYASTMVISKRNADGTATNETKIVEKFPLRAAEKIAALYNAGYQPAQEKINVMPTMTSNSDHGEPLRKMTCSALLNTAEAEDIALKMTAIMFKQPSPLNSLTFFKFTKRASSSLMPTTQRLRVQPHHPDTGRALVKSGLNGDAAPQHSNQPYPSANLKIDY